MLFHICELGISTLVPKLKTREIVTRKIRLQFLSRNLDIQNFLVKLQDEIFFDIIELDFTEIFKH